MVSLKINGSENPCLLRKSYLIVKQKEASERLFFFYMREENEAQMKMLMFSKLSRITMGSNNIRFS